MRTTLHDRHHCAQNADHLAHNHPFSPVFAEVVCTLCTTPTKATLGLPPNGGNGVIRDPTRRRHAASQPLMLQNPHRNRRGGHRATSAPKAPPVRRAPEGPRGLAAVPAARGRRGLAGQRAEAPIEARGADGRSGRHRHHRQPNLACNSPATRIDTSSKTTEYQRLESKPRHALTGIACGIDG